MAKQELNPRSTPVQSRGNKTVDRILSATAQLLETEGFEELTTNKICAKAGLTPPALYRYFPNKYAVVTELAKRLTRTQNQAMEDSTRRLLNAPSKDSLTGQILSDQIKVTREFEGGVAVLKTLYATPQLAEIRLKSHYEAVDIMLDIFAAELGDMSPKEQRHKFRVAVEIANSMVEMVVEDPALDEDAVIRDTARILDFYLSN